MITVLFVCLCTLFINFCMAESIFMKLLPLSLLGNRWVKCYLGNEYTLNDRRTSVCVFFYAIRVVS
jgi:hypothetical protein